MERPNDISLPFFAYGLFRPGQIAFFRLSTLVSKISEPVQIKGTILIRDGLPILDPTGEGHTIGALLTFLPDQAIEAYDKIREMEPDKQYRWSVSEITGRSANVLVGRHPLKGSVSSDDKEWDGWDDPLFNAALEVVEETLKTQSGFDWDLKPLFRLQMAYLLLWSSIERYLSLRYLLGGKPNQKLGWLATEHAFAESLQRHVVEPREIYRADEPDNKVVLDRCSPDKAVSYYYQIRSNITHRGKAVVRDHELLTSSLAELLLIFRDVLTSAKHEAVYRGNKSLKDPFN